MSLVSAKRFHDKTAEESVGRRRHIAMSSTPSATLNSAGLWVVSRDERPEAAQSHRQELRAVIEEWGRRSSPPDRATLLKQYEFLRNEITASLQLQQQILGFGIATIGLLAGAAFVGKDQPLRSQLLVGFLPLVSYLVVTIWFSEVMRMLRAGAFQLTLEKRLDECGDGSLDWEYEVAKSRLRRAGANGRFALDPDRLRLVAVTTLFFTLGGESIRLGWNDASAFTQTFAVATGVFALVFLRVLFRLGIAQWNDLLDVDPESRGVTTEMRVVEALDELRERCRLLKDRVRPRRRIGSGDRFRLAPRRTNVPQPAT
jgi:hypothetical protein